MKYFAKITAALLLSLILSTPTSALRSSVYFLGQADQFVFHPGTSWSDTDLFDGFEGIDCFFYEGAFSVYEDKGVSGINVPDIDFGWKNGVITPEFRRYIVDRPDALLEKCIIYDGGARRYEIPVHFDEVLEYWEGIRERADRIDVRALVEEKLGYAGPLDFEDWLDVTHLRGLDGLGPLWDGEQALLAQDFDLRALASRRIESIKNLKAQYENN
jgi:hypothetical protein